MLSEEYNELFKNDRLVAYIAENLADFCETELKDDSLLNVIKRAMDALCDGEYLTSIMEYYEYTPEEDQIKAVDRVYDLFELAYQIVEKWNADKVDNLTNMVRRQDMPFPCLLDTIYRLNHLCEQSHQKKIKLERVKIMTVLTVRKNYVIWDNGSVSIKDVKLTRDQVFQLSTKDMARYANFRLKQVGSDPWFRITKNGVYDLTTNIIAIGQQPDFYDNATDREFYDLLLDCNYEGTDLNGQLFNELCD